MAPSRSAFLSNSGPGAAGYSTVVGTNGRAGANNVTAYLFNEHMGQPIHEITPSLTWHISKSHNLKIVASAPIYLDAPLWIDNADGAYVFTDPTPSGATTLTTDEGSALTTAGNSAVRRTVAEGRLMFQFQF